MQNPASTAVAGEDRMDRAGIAAAIASIASIGIAIGLSFPLLSFILNERGYSATIIGANAATAGIASLAAVWIVTPLAQRIGIVRSLTVAALVAALSLIAFYLFDSIAIWFLLRVVFHGALTVSFVLSEFWINSASPEKQRGFVLGIYATVLSVGFGIGPGILAYTGSSGAAPFVIGMVIIAVAALPVLAARRREPSLAGHGSGSSFLKYVLLVPLATGAVFVFGAVEQSNLPLLPVYGDRLGYSEYEVAMFLMVLAAGNVVFQIPIGFLSDQLPDRRIVLFFLGLVGAAGAALIPFVVGDSTLFAITLFIWGGTISGLYTVGLAHLGSRLKGRELADANAAFAFSYTLGMIAGPQIAGIAMEYNDPHGFAWAVFGFFLLYLMICAWRATTR